MTRVSSKLRNHLLKFILLASIANNISLQSSGNCSYGCRSCSKSDPTYCFSCLQGYFLSDGDCWGCPTGCTKCASKSSCLQCETPLVLENNQCHSKNSLLQDNLFVVIFATVLFCLLLICTIALCRRKRNSDSEQPRPKEGSNYYPEVIVQTD